jgi:hypothetical protein
MGAVKDVCFQQHFSVVVFLGDMDLIYSGCDRGGDGVNKTFIAAAA